MISRKAGILIVTLVIPALIFIFLKFFAQNHYQVPFYNPVIAPNGNVLTQKGDTVFRQVSALHLRSANVDSSLKLIGKLSVINFVSASCEDSCQLVISQLQRVINLRSDIPYLVILSLIESSREGNDKPHAEFKQVGWRGIKASREDINQCLYEQLHFKTFGSGKKTNSLESELVLVDNEGYTRGYYNGYASDDIDRLMAEIKILNYEKKAGKQR